MKKRLLVVFLMLLATSGFVYLDNRLSRGTVPLDLSTLPLSAGGWRGTEYPVDERVKEILDTEYILSRDYVNRSGEHVFLSLVYYPDNRIGFHNPESCNTGVGMKVLGRSSIPLRITDKAGKNRTIEVNKLLLGDSEPAKVIYYFYVTGTAMTGNYPRFRWEMMRQQMGFRRPSGAQVQIHVRMPDGKDATYPLMEDFARAMIPELTRFLQ